MQDHVKTEVKKKYYSPYKTCTTRNICIRKNPPAFYNNYNTYTYFFTEGGTQRNNTTLKKTYIFKAVDHSSRGTMASNLAISPPTLLAILSRLSHSTSLKILFVVTLPLKQKQREAIYWRQWRVQGQCFPKRLWSTGISQRKVRTKRENKRWQALTLR